MKYIETTFDGFEQILVEMEQTATEADYHERFYPSPEQCDHIAKNFDKYYEFILFLLATQTNPMTQSEKESLQRLNRMIRDHLSYDSSLDSLNKE